MVKNISPNLLSYNRIQSIPISIRPHDKHAVSIAKIPRALTEVMFHNLSLFLLQSKSDGNIYITFVLTKLPLRGLI